MSNRKRHSKKLPKIVQTIQESNILKLDKDIATAHIIKLCKSDARMNYCHFNGNTTKLSDAFDWNIVYPGFNYWSNLNNLLINTKTNDTSTYNT